ncbi:uncharacterized protein LOC135824552 [Sycon ciliatum]|uniref:uncharacterized protein LOC135824552 n=1 Tax=Sycon ciliatum TaxID=27933 RepID=UPI0031F65D04|eukprot:scpid59176/ scgid15396/ D-arabinono-1,4-lactone oxidase; L-galactono-gamma-lactone oxidase
MDVRNWGGELLTRPVKYKQVTRVDEIVEVVTDPDQYPSPVRALGSRHSTTDCIDADNGTVLDMRRLDCIKDPDERNMTITVGSGARYYDISHKLQAHGLMLHVNTEIGNLTAGAAVVGQTKDSAFPDEHGQVSSYVVSVRMITADGQDVSVHEDTDPELMRLVRGSFGLLGIVYEVTFKIAPLRLMRLYHKVYTLDEFIDGLDEIRSSGCAVMYYMMPFCNRIIVEFRSYIPDKWLDEVEDHCMDGDCVNNKHLLPYGSDWQFAVRNMSWAKVTPLVGRLVQMAPCPLRNALYMASDYLALCVLSTLAGYHILPAEQTILYNDKPFKATQYTFSIFSFPVAGFSQVLRDYFAFLQTYHKRTGWRCSLVNVGYRLFEDNKSFLSYSAGSECMTLDPVSSGGDDNWYPFLKDYNQFCLDNGGKPLMNQTPCLTPEITRSCFGPQLDHFDIRRRQMDPDGRFLNGYFRRLFEFQ